MAEEESILYANAQSNMSSKQTQTKLFSPRKKYESKLIKSMIRAQIR